MTRTAVIVGAGIGGLSAGIALQQAGWNVRLLERATSARELGFGLAVAPNAIAALRALGVADVVLARGYEPTQIELRRLNGTVLKRVDLPPGALGGPLLMALRPAIHGALLDAVGMDAIALESHVTGLTSTDGHARLQMADGSVAEGDLLVGADGVNSVVRRAIHPSEPQPRSSGIVAVRGVVHGVLRYLGGLSVVYYLGPGVESVVARASDTGIYWFVSLARKLLPRSVRDPSTVLAHVSPWFDATFRAVTSYTDDLRYDELVDRDPLPFWGRSGITLLGDAAHPMLPHTGQGAAQAMVDAVTLAKALRSPVDIEQGLKAYERERLGKTATLVRQGRRMARVMRTTNPVACALREAAVRVMPGTLLARISARINRRAGTNVSGRARGCAS